eukprot:sb/3463971/
MRFDCIRKSNLVFFQEARMLTQAESCSVFLVDSKTHELVAKVFDGTLVDGEKVGKGHEIRIPINKGIAGNVGRYHGYHSYHGYILLMGRKWGRDMKLGYQSTRELQVMWVTMVTSSASSSYNLSGHGAHYPLPKRELNYLSGVDEATGFLTRNILCFPIKDDTGVIGVAQLCNKSGGKYFTRHDEEAALSFSVYCGISISNSLLFKKVQDAQYRSKLASDLMIYHMQVPQTELDSALQDVKLNCGTPPSFHCLLFPTYIVDEESKTVALAYHMFEDLNLISRWQLSPQTLLRFLLMVRRGVYCGISISNSLLFKKVQDAQYRSKLASDLMIYHMQVPQTELDSALQDVKLNCGTPPSFHCLLFPTYIVDEESKTVALAYHMFEDLNLISRWQLSPQTLLRFLLMVRRGYRDPPYHNWMHAFCVGHFFYALCKTVDMSAYLADIEVLAMLIACFCHDLDHRGTTNAFQVASRSVLACLYSSEGSVMERHHFAQTFCILNTSGCNIMEG